MGSRLDLLDKLHKEFGQLHSFLQSEAFPCDSLSESDSMLLWLARDQADRVKKTLRKYSEVAFKEGPEALTEVSEQ